MSEPPPRGRMPSMDSASRGRRSSRNFQSAGKARQNKTTMVDLFLAGGDGELDRNTLERKAQCQELRVQWIMDPDESEETYLDDVNKVGVAIEEKGKTAEEVAARRETLRRELILQEYWKKHAAEAPGMSHLRAVVEDCKHYEKLFRQSAYGFDESGHARNLHFKQSWVVMSLQKVGVRSSPTTDVAAMTQKTLAPGSCVIVDTAVFVDGIHYVKLVDGGWAFDRFGDTHVMSRMEDVEVGFWWYHYVGKSLVETRLVPTYDHAARTGFVLCHEEVLIACCRCSVEGQHFLRLADGRGWVFLERPANAAGMDEGSTRLFVPCTGQLDRDMHASRAGGPRGDDQNGPGFVEHGLWKYEVLDRAIVVLGLAINGITLEPGTVFLCDMRVPGNGKRAKEVSVKSAQSVLSRTWLRLDDGSGWLPKTDMDNKPLVRFAGAPKRRRGASAGATTPRGEAAPLPPPEVHLQDWRAGIA